MANKRKIVLRNDRVKVTAHFHEQGSVLAGSAEGACDGFEIDISLDSDAPAAEIAELIRLAHRMCFTEDALSHPARLTYRHTLNGEPIEIKTR